MDFELSPSEWRERLTRRSFLSAGVQGIGSVALASLLARDLKAAPNPIGALPGLPHFAPKAKRMICLWQGGGPSHVDLFDPKPTLLKTAGQEIPASVRGDTRLSTMSSGYAKYIATPAIKPFKKWGASGIELSEMLPHLGSIADEICVVRSMNTEAVNHAPGVTFFMTGSQIPGRPSMGAWLSYGLGTMNEDLPAYVVMTSSDAAKTCGQLFFEHYWSNGFLPGKHQGVRFRGVGDPVPFVNNPAGVSRDSRRTMLDDMQSLNRAHFGEVGDPAIDTRISQYEMAFRMQTSVPDLLDLSKEPQHVLDLYGPDVKRPGSYASNCLLARRLCERDVRFIQLFHMGWDHHGGLPKAIKGQCNDTDQATAGLLTDLKQRGLLDDTLIVWGGEFGRTTYSQGTPSETNYGRDHHPRCFTVLMAGAGVNKGTTYGETDDFSYNIVKESVHVHDLNATILHLMGVEHTRLTYRYQGRDFRLTDIHGEVVKKLLA